MPEIAGFYLVGVLITATIGLVFGSRQRSRYHSKQYIILQKNLQKIELRWNDLNAAVEKIKIPEDINPENSAHQFREEYGNARKSALILLSSASVLSWLGLLFLIVIWGSLRVLAKSRSEISIFASPLTASELARNEVESIYKNLNQES